MICEHCKAIIEAANDNHSATPKSVTVATDEVISSPSYHRRLALATANLNTSRRKLADDIVDALFLFEGELLWPDGAVLYLSDTCLDDAFGGDGSFRWLSQFIRHGQTPLLRRPQSRILERLRLIDLYFKIKHPSIARHFGR